MGLASAPCVNCRNRIKAATKNAAQTNEKSPAINDAREKTVIERRLRKELAANGPAKSSKANNTETGTAKLIEE